MATTRTLNPLPFEHLEPKRFEDMVRQLAYDFRPWQSLEATGRSGGDEGFDARGFEARSEPQPLEVSEEVIDETEEPEAGRVWLIQCKREKSIAPAKARKHLAEINIGTDEPVYGLIFAAACDFSKKTRDEIRGWARENNIAEVVIWGKGEIEDLLFQPKNDNLLFAYFGISLKIRSRSVRTKLRLKLSAKRKCDRHLSEAHDVLVRHALDDDYPNLPPEGQKPAKWGVGRLVQIHPSALIIEWESYFAYVSDDYSQWDYVEDVDESHRMDPNYWDGEPYRTFSVKSSDVDRFWRSLPSRNRFKLMVYTPLPFEDILDIDEKGDRCAEFPHIYVEDFTQLKRKRILRLESYDNEDLLVDQEKLERIKFFPDVFPEQRKLATEGNFEVPEDP